MRQVIFIQYGFPSDSREFLSLIKRWEEYAFELSKINVKHKIRIIHFKNFTPDQTSQMSDKIQDFYTLFGPIRIFSLISALRSLIEVEKSELTLVCGDAHVSYLVARILRFCIPNQIKIQTQFHGDLYSFAGKFSISLLLRVFIARNAIKSSDSIRIVSNFQKNEILKVSSKASKKFVVAPISIDIAKISSATSSRDIDLLFVGRLHKERGITDLISLINQISSTDATFKTLIVGEGPERGILLSSLIVPLQSGRAQLAGYLESSALLKAYLRSKVLISTAPSEGYGLTLREAALNGLAVIARNSRGAKETQELFPNQIFLYEKLDEAIQLVRRLCKSDFAVDQAGLLAAQQERDMQSRKRLIESWI